MKVMLRLLEVVEVEGMMMTHGGLVIHIMVKVEIHLKYMIVMTNPGGPWRKPSGGGYPSGSGGGGHGSRG